MKKGFEDKYLRISGDTVKNLILKSENFLLQHGKEGKNTEKPANISELWETLQGDWVGNQGWNAITMPNPGTTPEDEGNAFIMIQQYYETLSIKNAGAPARNRGGSLDQFVAALEYQQRVTDSNTNELLHVENGMFLNLSSVLNNKGEVQPTPEFTIARSGTIPHGDSIMLAGKTPLVAEGKPGFGAPENTSVSPQNVGDNFGYQENLFSKNTVPSPLPAEFDLQNANNILKQHLEQQEKNGFRINSTTTLIFDSDNNGGIQNIPFIVRNANATRMQAVFWLEKVEKLDTGQVFDQLQYTQVIDLSFQHSFGKDGKPGEGQIIWPHITVNTMVRQ